MRFQVSNRQGATALELAVSLFATTMLLFGSFDLVFPIFMQGALGHAARTGVERALEPETTADDVRAAVVEGSMGLLANGDRVHVKYVDPLGTETENPSPGGLVTVWIEGVPAARILPGFWGADASALHARAADVLP